MELKPIQHKVVEIVFHPTSEDFIDKPTNFNLEFEPDFSNCKYNKFSIIFNLFIVEHNKYIVKLKYETIFETNSEIDEDFKNSHFPYINAPAIGFPFLRSFVSFLILNAGYSPLILPSINFVKFKNETIE